MFKRFSLIQILNFPLRWLDSSLSNKSAVGWGQLPLNSVVFSFGVWIIAFGENQARAGLGGGVLFFWLGTIIIYFPLAARFVSKDVSRREALGMLFLLAIGTFLYNYMRSPLLFRSFDEFLHWRTAYDIFQSRHLFTYNPLLPISPLYPGLEIVTIAVASMSGLNIINAGYLILFVARIIIIFSLYLLFEWVTKSVQTAGVATLIYTGSSTFLFFDMAFGYESLALPLAVMAVYMLLSRSSTSGRTYWAWTFLAALVSFAIVITHHSTSYAMVAFLLLWTCTDLYIQWVGLEGINPFSLAAWVIVLCLVWLGTYASSTLNYLSTIFGGAYDSLMSLISGKSAARHLFENSSGQGAVNFERILALGAVFILVTGILIGLWQWWLGYRRVSIASAFAIAGLIYPALPLMRLSAGAWEVSNRLSGFIFIAVGFLVALGMVEFPVPAHLIRPRQMISALGVVIIFMGGIVAGSSPLTRLPGPYLPAAENRSIDSEGVLTAEWARDILGSNNRMVGDRTLTTLMGAYGTQRMIVDLSDKVSISGLFLHYKVTPSDREIIAKADIHYAVVDFRIKNVLPLLGYYFEAWEQQIVSFVPPVNIAALEKFDFTKNVSRIFDSGNIVIYEIGALRNAP